MIKIEKLNVKYRDKQILENVNLELKDNGIYFLMGKNGSGKTTFINTLASLIKYQGCILFNNQSIDKIRGDIFVVFDDIPLHLNLTGMQNIKLLCTNVDEKIVKNLNILDLDKLNRKTSTYSLGEKRKLYLIMIYLVRPKYLFIDEMANGLDLDTLKVMKNILIEISKNSLVIASGHYLHFYQEISTHLLILKNNSICFDDSFFEKGGDLLYEYEKQFNYE